jgi:predicted anti-sigma-YlaC factor YlaD
MNTCKRFSESFSDYVENTLLPEQQRTVEAHLSVCGDCQSAIARLQDLRSTLSRLPKLQAPPDFEAIIRAQARRERKRAAAPVFAARLPFMMPRLTVFAVASVLVFLSVNFVLRQTSGVDPQGAGFSNQELLLSPLHHSASSVIPLTAQILYTLDNFSPRQWLLPRNLKGARGSLRSDSLSVDPEELPHGPQNNRASLFSL